MKVISLVTIPVVLLFTLWFLWSEESIVPEHVVVEYVERPVGSVQQTQPHISLLPLPTIPPAVDPLVVGGQLSGDLVMESYIRQVIQEAVANGCPERSYDFSQACYISEPAVIEEKFGVQNAESQNPRAKIIRESYRKATQVAIADAIVLADYENPENALDYITLLYNHGIEVWGFKREELSPTPSGLISRGQGDR